MRLETQNTRTLRLAHNTGSAVRFTPARGPQGLPGPGSAAWAADTAVTTGTVRQAPDGSWIKSTGNRTTRPSFDATEATFWEAVLASSGTVEATALTAAYARGVSVTSTGAVGDGVTDDSAAIKAADTAAVAFGAELYFPAGEYLVSKDAAGAYAFTVSTKWISNGAILKLADGAPASTSILKIVTDGASVSGFVLDGNTAGQSVEAQHQRHGIYVDQAVDVSITNNTIRNCAGDGVLLYRACDRARVSGNVIHGTDRSGVALVGDSDDVLITDNHIYDIGSTPIDGEVENVGAGYAKNAHIRGNILDGTNINFALSCSTVNAATRNLGWIIEGNTILGAVTLLRSDQTRFVNNRVELVGGSVPAVTASVTTDALIAGNHITVTSTTVKAIVAEYTLSTAPVNVTIVDNTIRAGNAGILVAGVKRALVSRNIVIGSGTASANGITVHATAATTDVEITNNLVSNFNLAAVVATMTGANTIDGLRVGENIYRDDQGSPTMVRGLRLEGTASQYTNVVFGTDVSAATVAFPFGDNTTGGPVATKRGFFGKAPVVQPAAYTQTYATASRTQAALTSANAVGAPTQAEYDALRADLINTKQVLNSVVDDLQTLGLFK